MVARSLVALSVVALAVACDQSTTPHAEKLGTTQERMVGGTISPASQDSVVDLAQGDSSCTATLIAPDLVITAHHCVAEEGAEADCAALGGLLDPATIEVKLNTVSQKPEDDATFESPTVAKGKQIWVPTTNNICSFDVALIKLNKPVPNAKISNIRFSAIAPNESVTAVGFGVDGDNVNTLERMQRTTTVLGVGPTTVAFVSQGDGTFNFKLPQGDVMTGESHCYGDSGGPLFDKDGNIVAIISRGPEGAPDNDKHGNGCVDMAETYSGIAFNEAFIREAAKQAGSPLSTGPIASTTGAVTTPAAEDKTTATGDDDDDDSTATKKKKTSSTIAAQPAGCTAAPGSHGSAGLWLAALGIALVVKRRRRA